MSTLSQKHLHDEAAAYEFVEAILWPNGPVCPRCKETVRIGKLTGKSTRVGVYKCYRCRKPFTVKVSTIFVKRPAILTPDRRPNLPPLDRELVSH